jgi:hypothetical protein
MTKDAVFCVTVITKGQLFARCDRLEGEVDVLLIFLCFYRMTTGTIHVDKAFPKVKERIGICVAVHTGKLASMVDVPGPIFRVDIQSPDCTVTGDLGYFGFAVACQTILIRVV